MQSSRKHGNSIHWISVLLAYSTLFLLGMADNLRGPLYPDVLKDLALTDTQGSWLWALASVFGFVGSGIAPRMMSSQGLLGTLRWALVFMVLGQVGMALSPSLLYALCSSVSFGLSLGLLGVVQNILVLQAGPPSEIQRLQAGLHSNYAGASLLAPLFLSGLAFFFSSWRAGYLGGAILSLIGLLSLWRVDSSSLEDHHGNKSHHPDRGRFPRFKALLIAAMISFYVVMEIMISSRLALFLRREAGFDFQSASLATTLFFVGLLAGRILFVFWRPKFRLKTQLMSSLFCSFILMILGLWVDPIWMILTGLTMAPFYPLGMSYLGEKFPRYLGAATSLTMALTGIFVVMMHLGVGSLTESIGILNALKVGPAAAMAAFLLLASDSLFANGKKT